MPHTYLPAARRVARRRSSCQLPTRAHPALPARRPASRPPASPALRILAAIGFILVMGAALLAGLVLAGQHELVAWIVVGATLTVVFGTPLLCLVGLVAVYLAAIGRMGRARRRPPPAPVASAPHPAGAILVSEVVIDD